MALRQQAMASAGWPPASSATPRLLWALARFGSSSMALCQQAMASAGLFSASSSRPRVQGGGADPGVEGDGPPVTVAGLVPPSLSLQRDTEVNQDGWRAGPGRQGGLVELGRLRVPPLYRQPEGERIIDPKITRVLQLR